MSKYYKLLAGEKGEISLYPSLGAIAEFEDLRGKNFLESMAGAKPLTNDLFTLIHQCYLASCKRQNEIPKLRIDDLIENVTYIEAQLKIDEMTTDLLKAYGIDLKVKEEDKQKKTK
jgi:hypothetical protein